MLPFIISILSVLLFVNSALCDDSFGLRVSLPREVSWALVAVDLKTGRELVRTGNALAEPLMPGSLVKLFTSGAALEYRERHGAPDLTTTILHDGDVRDGTLHGNLFIVGRGNTLLSGADMTTAARKIAQMGIGQVTGDIVADDSFFDTTGLERTHTGAGHAPAGALGLDLHTVAILVTPTGPGKPPKVVVEPPNDAVRLAVAARTAAASKETLAIVQIDDTAYNVSGNIAPDAGLRKWRFPLKAPDLYAAGVLKTGLQKIGVKVEGHTRRGRTPANVTLLAEVAGPELRNLVRDMNVNSLNVAADNLLLSIGAVYHGVPGTREKGLRALAAFLDPRVLPKREASFVDGSGLREENRVTVGYIVRYLRAVAQKPWFTTFRASLPRPGLDGTLRDIGYRNDRFRVKSGRLENAFGLAGYGVDRKGKEIAFSYIVNVPIGGAGMDLERSGAEVMKYLGTEDLQ